MDGLRRMPEVVELPEDKYEKNREETKKKETLAQQS